MDTVAGKTALITGGGSGINLEFARLLHAAGCNILIADLALHKDATTWIAQLSTGAPSVVFQQTNVTDWTQLERAFDVCSEKMGSVPDIVVPGAGVYEPSHKSFWEDSDSSSRYMVLDINLVHPIKTTRIAIRRLVRAGKTGTIIHVSSIAGQRSSIITPLYTASKHGINSFIRGMQPLHELVGIKVVGVAPGTVATPLFTENQAASQYLDFGKDFLLPPQEVAKAMLALITDDKYGAGTVLEVCDVGNWREVALLNDPGPSGPASLTSKKHEAIAGVLAILQEEGGQTPLVLRAPVRTD